jgi:hypothetical protein
MARRMNTFAEPGIGAAEMTGGGSVNEALWQLSCKHGTDIYINYTKHADQNYNSATPFRPCPPLDTKPAPASAVGHPDRR